MQKYKRKIFVRYRIFTAYQELDRMNWLQRYSQYGQPGAIQQIFRAYDSGKELGERPGSWTRRQLSKPRFRSRSRSPQSPVVGPGRYNCTGCGRYVPQGGTLDSQGRVFCPQCAHQQGIVEMEPQSKPERLAVEPLRRSTPY